MRISVVQLRARYDVHSHDLQINCAVKEIPFSCNDPRVGGADLKSYNKCILVFGILVVVPSNSNNNRTYNRQGYDKPDEENIRCCQKLEQGKPFEFEKVYGAQQNILCNHATSGIEGHEPSVKRIQAKPELRVS